MTEHIRINRGLKIYLQRLIYSEYGKISMSKGIYHLIEGYIWARQHGYKPTTTTGRYYR